MNDVVWIALITGLVAVVPQILTWWQNKKRDVWEKTTRAETVARDERLAAERAKSERDALGREAIVKYVDAASRFVVACAVASGYEYHAGSTKTHEAIEAFGPLVTASNEALVVLRSTGASSSAAVIELMFSEIDRWAEPTAGTLALLSDDVRIALTRMWPTVGE